MDKSRLSLSAMCYLYLFAVVAITQSQGQPTVRQQQHQSSTSSSNSGSATLQQQHLLSPIKKDVFMSRGWGASGMPFTMFYLNHYTKAQQKAYAQNQQLLQQQQQQQQQQLAQQQQKARLAESESELDRPRTLPYGSRYGEPMANAQLGSETTGYTNNNSIKHDDEYTADSLGSAAAAPAYLPANNKPSTPRRQYNVPQLFVSYGWGPMG